MFLGYSGLWRIMLSAALTCFRKTKNNNIPPPKKGKKEEKKDMQVESNGAAAVKVFWKKILPGVKRRVEIFFQKLVLTLTAGKRNC